MSGASAEDTIYTVWVGELERVSLKLKIIIGGQQLAEKFLKIYLGYINKFWKKEYTPEIMRWQIKSAIQNALSGIEWYEKEPNVQLEINWLTNLLDPLSKTCHPYDVYDNSKQINRLRGILVDLNQKDRELNFEKN